MENASKAMLIAGAVLIALAIIGIAIYFFQNSREIGEMFNNDISDLRIKQHNNEFAKYKGEINSDNLKGLVIKVASYNRDNPDMEIRFNMKCYEYNQEETVKKNMSLSKENNYNTDEILNYIAEETNTMFNQILLMNNSEYEFNNKKTEVEYDIIKMRLKINRADLEYRYYVDMKYNRLGYIDEINVSDESNIINNDMANE